MKHTHTLSISYVSYPTIISGIILLLRLSVIENSAVANFGNESVIMFGENESVQQIIIALVDDDVVEANEIIQVKLSTTVEDSVELITDTATIIIIDDDGQLVASILYLSMIIFKFLQK